MIQHSKTVDNCEACWPEFHEKTSHLRRWCAHEERGVKGWPYGKKMNIILSLLVILLVSLGLACGLMQHLQHKRHNNLNLWSSSRTNIPILPVIQNPYDPERSEMDDRSVLQDAQTRFIPIDSPYIKYKDKRSISEDSWNTYQGNATSDLVIWEVQDGGEAASQDDDCDQDILPNKQKDRDNPSVDEITDDGEYDEVPPGNNNDVIANYPDDEQEATYDEDNTESREDNLMYELPQNSEWKPNQPRVDNSDTNIKEEDENEQVEESLPALRQSKTTRDSGDFHAFWKGEGNRHTIRHAQGKLMRSFMDESIDPCDDFYQYACGNWEHKNPIPKDKAGFDTFEMLRENLDLVLRELLEKPVVEEDSLDLMLRELLEKPVTEEDNLLADMQWKGGAKRKAQQLYQSCMNYEILEQRGSQPLLDLLDDLGGWPLLDPNWDSSSFDWLALMSELRLYNNDILISEWVGPDIKNSDEYVIQFDQTSLGLPTRDYYIQSSNLGYLEAYKSYLITIATLLGGTNVNQEADDIIEFETKLAKITSAPDERRNVSEFYIRMTLGQLQEMVPEIDWQRYLSIVLARPCNSSEPVVMFALNYMQDLVTLLYNSEPRTIANYLLWRFVRHRVSNLDDDFQDAKQEFYFKLFGREQAPPRWKNCVAQVNSNMGMAVGAMFVTKYFDENSKNDTLKMTEEIMQSFRELIRENNWIDKETKGLAIDKVDAMILRIGYPDFILDDQLLDERYKDVDIRPDKYFENTLNILRHLTRMEQDRLGTPVNKSLWNTAPAVVNAYYSRNKNQIMFPAGILQPPFYHRHFPRSLNYGGIGVVIGHEITHGFDDKGRLFDKYGNLHRWWHDEAIDGFHKRAQCLIDQYSHYTVEEVHMKVDGVSTQGENIADNGGIKQSFRAYQRWLDDNSDEGETLPGVNATGHQLFFLNFAQVWCGTIRPEALKNKLKTAVHSPGKFRVIGTLSNSEDFASVFGCPAGSPMNPVDKCSVW